MQIESFFKKLVHNYVKEIESLTISCEIGGITDQMPSVFKSNRLHVAIVQFFFIRFTCSR